MQPPSGIFSESSEDDILRDNADEQLERDDGFISQHLKNMRGLMRMIKDQKSKVDEKEKLKKDESLQNSSFSNINPLEDPLSEIGSPECSRSIMPERRDSMQLTDGQQLAYSMSH